MVKKPKDASLTKDDAHYVVQRLLFAMHIYSGYKIDSRGPSGCIFDAIQRLDPKIHAKLVKGVDPGDLMDEEDGP